MRGHHMCFRVLIKETVLTLGFRTFELKLLEVSHHKSVNFAVLVVGAALRTIMILF